MFQLSGKSGSRDNTFLQLGVDRANEFVSVLDTGSDLIVFVKTVVVPLLKVVLYEHFKLKPVFTQNELYSMAYKIFKEVGSVTVMNGGLKGSNRDYAQAEIQRKICHINPDWINSAGDAAEDGELVVLAHNSVLVVKILHAFIHLFTPGIMRTAHMLAGTPEKELLLPDAFDTPIKIGKNIVEVFDSQGNKVRSEVRGDMGLQGEEEIFGYRIQFEPLSSDDADTFSPQGVLLTDESREGRVFKTMEMFRAWALAVTTGPVDPDLLRVRSCNTMYLNRRKKIQNPHKSSSGDLVSNIDESAEEDNMISDDNAEKEQYQITIPDLDDFVHYDSLLPKGWKN